MGAAASVDNDWFTLAEVKALMGNKWSDQMYQTFLETAVVHPAMDGTHDGCLRIKGNRLYFEIAAMGSKEMPKDEASSKKIKRPSGKSELFFTDAELSSSSEPQCSQADAYLLEHMQSEFSDKIRAYLTSLPVLSNQLENTDTSLRLYGEDPAPGVHDICEEYASYFLDMEFPPGASVAPPRIVCGGISDFSNIRSFARLSAIHKHPSMFGGDVNHMLWNDICCGDRRVGNTEIASAIAAVAYLQQGTHLRRLINPPDPSIYGVYSVKVTVTVSDEKCARSASTKNKATEDEEKCLEGAVRTTHAWILVDDFVPCDEIGRPVFCHHKQHTIDDAEGASLWPYLIEKAVVKLYGRGLGGYSALVHRPEYAGDIMTLLTGLQCREYDPSSPKDWKLLKKYMSSPLKDCRFGAATVTREGLRRIDAPGLVVGTGLQAFQILAVAEVPTKFKNSLKIIRLRNPGTCVTVTAFLILVAGVHEWTGAWSDDSKEAKTYKSILANHTVGSSEGGCFWMSVEDFVRIFPGVYGILAPPQWKG